MTEQEFHDTLDAWSKETAYVSSTEKIQEHPSFTELVKAGKEIISYIRAELEARENRLLLMLVLQEIYGFSPVKPENQGLIENMTCDWLKYLQGD